MANVEAILQRNNIEEIRKLKNEKLEKCKELRIKLYDEEKEVENLKATFAELNKKLTNLTYKVDEQNLQNNELIMEDSDNIIGMNRIEEKVNKLVDKMLTNSNIRKAVIEVCYGEVRMKYEIEHEGVTFGEIKIKVGSMYNIDCNKIMFANENGVLYNDSFFVQSILYPIDGFQILNYSPRIFIKEKIQFELDMSEKIYHEEKNLKVENKAEDDAGSKRIQSSKIIVERILAVVFIILNIVWYLNCLEFKRYNIEYSVNESVKLYVGRYFNESKVYIVSST